MTGRPLAQSNLGADVTPSWFGLVLSLSLDGCGAPAAPTPPAPVCQAPTPVTTPGGQSGLQRCADGAVDRISPPLFRVPEQPRCQGTEASRTCEADADCTRGSHGQCAHRDDPGYDTALAGFPICSCVYACTSDAECGADEACVPAPGTEDGRGECAPASCRQASDCPSGACGLSSWFDGCDLEAALVCRSNIDTCRGAADCGPLESCAVHVLIEEMIFACRGDSCDVGRPIRSRGVALTAPTVEDSAWSEPEATSANDAQPPCADAFAIGRWWADVAAYEHASVASFGRFLLQLIRIGAPPDLMLRATQAAADEVAHAQAAYRIARRLLGQAVGPGPLPVEDVDAVWDVAGVLVEVIREGCVGETIAVAEAAAALEGTEDPEVRRALEAVVADESKHAALAWRTARWLIGQDPSLVDVAHAALTAACQDAAAPVPGLFGAERWGVLSGAARTAARRSAAAHEVVALAKMIFGAAPVPLG